MYTTAYPFAVAGPNPAFGGQQTGILLPANQRVN